MAAHRICGKKVYFDPGTCTLATADDVKVSVEEWSTKSDGTSTPRDWNGIMSHRVCGKHVYYQDED